MNSHRYPMDGPAQGGESRMARGDELQTAGACWLRTAGLNEAPTTGAAGGRRAGATGDRQGRSRMPRPGLSAVLCGCLCMLALLAAAFCTPPARAISLDLSDYTVSSLLATMGADDGRPSLLLATTNYFYAGDGSGGGGGASDSSEYAAGNGGAGQGGNDTIEAGHGNDVIFGDGSGGGGGSAGSGGTAGFGGAAGGGNDTLYGSHGDDIIFGDGYKGVNGTAGTNVSRAYSNGGFGGGGGGGGYTYAGHGGLLAGGGGSDNGASYVGNSRYGGSSGGNGLPTGYDSDHRYYYGGGSAYCGGLSYEYSWGGSGSNVTAGAGGGGFGGLKTNTSWLDYDERTTYDHCGGSQEQAGAGGSAATVYYVDSDGGLYTYVHARLADIAARTQIGTTNGYGSGADTIHGGPDDDDLFGLGGNDTFVFDLPDVYGDADTIWDFRDSGSDLLSLKINGVLIDSSWVSSIVAGQTASGTNRIITFATGDYESTITIYDIGTNLTAAMFNTGSAAQDFVAPTVTGTNTADSTTSGWNTTSPTTVTITATDGVSNIAHIFYKVDGEGSFTAVAKSGSKTASTDVAISGEGNHTITYYASDAVGNESAQVTKYVNIDSAAPATTCEGLAADAHSDWRATEATVSLAAQDATSGVATTYFKVDGAASWSTYSGPFTVSGEGTHAVVYYTKDVAGNDESQQTGYVNIDTTAPVTTTEDLAADDHSGWYTGDTEVALTATDAGSGTATTYFKVDGAESWTAYAEPFVVAGEGSHTVAYYSVDALGNEEGEQTGYVNIDATAPTVAGDADEAWHRTDVTVTLTGDDGSGAGSSGVAALQYRLAGASEWSDADENGRFTVAAPGDGSNDGAHDYELRALDAAGNASETGTATVRIDTTGPQTASEDLVADETAGWRVGPVTVTLAAADAGSGVAATYYKVDGAESWTDYSEPLVLSEEGSHAITYYSVDAIGNEEGQQTGYVNIDSNAPQTTAGGLAADDHSDWSSVPVSVTFAVNGGSGSVTTYYKVDGAESWTAYTEPFTVSGGGSHSVRYYSVDERLVNEAVKTGYVNIDAAAPTVASDADTAWHRTDVTVTLTGDDGSGAGSSGVAALQYRLAGASEWSDADENGRFTVAAPGDGSNDGAHDYELRALDAAGNASETGTATVRIDATLPTIASDADGAWHDGDVTVTLTGDDGSGVGSSGVAALQYRLVGSGEWLDADENGRFTVAAPGDGSNDGAHDYELRALDAAGNASETGTATVRIDTTGPQTASDGLAADDHSSWHNSDVTVTLAATDAGCGVGDTSYKVVDGAGIWMTYSEPFTVAGEGSHTVVYYSVDALGNQELVQTGYVNISGNVPQTSATGLAADNHSEWSNVPVSVTLSTSGGSGSVTTYYKVDGAESWTAYTEPFTVSGEGSHTVSYYSVDEADVDEAVKTGYVNIDAALPTIVSDADEAWHSGEVTVTLTGDDGSGAGASGVAALQYRLVGSGEWLDADENGRFTVAAPGDGSNDGAHDYELRALDAAGNASETGTATVRIDATLPTIASDADGAWHDGDVTVTLTGDDGSGTGSSGVQALQYRLAGASEWSDADENGRFVVAGPSDGANDGAHDYELRALDVAGNASETGTATVRIDTTAPQTTSEDLAADDHSSWHNSDVTVTLAATDAGCGVGFTYYTVDGAESWTTYTEPFTVAGEGSHTVVYYSVDALGNQELVQTGYVNIDTDAPATAATNLQADTTSGETSDPVTVTLTAEDPTSSVAHIYYKLDAGGFVEYGGPFTISEAGSTLVTFYAVDAAGNEETAQTGYVNIVSAGPPSGGFTINGGASSTASLSVCLGSAVANATDMRFSNDEGATWSDWQRYDAYAYWILPDGEGSKTVSAEYRNSIGETFATTASITFDLAAPSGTMSINGGAGSTADTAVTICNAVDNGLEMRFRNAEGEWAGWQAYAGEASWNLPAGDGAKTVEAQYRNATRTLSLSTTITLAADAPSGTLTINGGEPVTSSAEVTLHNAVTGAIEMRFHNAGETFGAWRAYSEAVAWTLTAGDGPKVVEAEYRNASGDVLSIAAPVSLSVAPADPKQLSARWVVVSGRKGRLMLSYRLPGGGTAPLKVTAVLRNSGGANIGTYTFEENPINEVITQPITLTLPLDVYRVTLSVTDAGELTSSGYNLVRFTAK